MHTIEKYSLLSHLNGTNQAFVAGNSKLLNKKKSKTDIFTLYYEENKRQEAKEKQHVASYCLNPKSMQHIDHIFSSNVPRSSLGIGATTESSY